MWWAKWQTVSANSGHIIFVNKLARKNSKFLSLATQRAPRTEFPHSSTLSTVKVFTFVDCLLVVRLLYDRAQKHFAAHNAYYVFSGIYVAATSFMHEIKFKILFDNCFASHINVQKKAKCSRTSDTSRRSAPCRQYILNRILNRKSITFRASRSHTAVARNDRAT